MEDVTQPNQKISVSGKNRTIELTDEEKPTLRERLLNNFDSTTPTENLIGTIHGDYSLVLKNLPLGFVDLLFLDPPYNLTKDFNGWKFSKVDVEEYTIWLDHIIVSLKPLLKPTASIYICGEWFTSASIFQVAEAHFVVRNRITWEREKGRGSKSNWKSSSEDIWFCTVSNSYTFNSESVKIRKKVIAPYRQADGTPKDWQITEHGAFRDTHPSNLWTDITVPFWSMPENTKHPTQKSEKLVAKLILASTNPGDFVLDPFLGSGTTSVVSKKLARQYLGIELNEEYCLLAEKRLDLVDSNRSIQGFHDGVFWERNTLRYQVKDLAEETQPIREQELLFDLNKFKKGVSNEGI